MKQLARHCEIYNNIIFIQSERMLSHGSRQHPVDNNVVIVR